MACRSTFIFILITILVDGLGIGIMMPVFPRLLMELTGKSIADAAALGGLLSTLFAGMQFFASPVLGNLSDRFGRRPILLGSLAALGICYFVLGFAPHMSWIFIGQLFAGMFAATYSAAGAYVTDITAPNDRTKHFGMMAGAFGAGFVMGPMLGGLLSQYSLRLPFFVGSALALLNMVYGFFMLSESLPADRRRAFSLLRANPLGAFHEMRKQPLVLRMLGVLALFHGAGMTLAIIWPYLTMLKFGWSQSDVGLSLSLYVGASLAVQSGLSHIVCRQIGQAKSMCLGLALHAIGMIGFAFASVSWIMLAFILPATLGSMTVPALTSYLTERTAPNAQGELQGALASIASVAALSTPFLMTQLFKTFTANDSIVHFPGAPYLLASAFTFAALLLTWHVLRQERNVRTINDLKPFNIN